MAYNKNLSQAPMTDQQLYIDALNKLNDSIAIEQEAEYELFNTKVANTNALFDLKVKLTKKLRDQELSIERQAQEDFLKVKEDAVEAEIKKRERQGKKVSAKQMEAIRKKIDKTYKYSDATRKRYEEIARKRAKKQEEKERKEAGKRYLEEQSKTLLDKGQTWEDRKEALKELTHTTDKFGRSQFDINKTFVTMTKVLSNLSQQLDKRVDEIAANKAAIDTRLQGSRSNTLFGWGLESQWDRISKELISVAGMSPLYRQENIVKNLNNLVGRGISYNITQRAFLQTISEKIATTFDAANGTLLRLVRVQQQDTTAGRLGMESALNTFLNQMYETTEYMSDIMTSVKGSLEESMSLMGGAEAVAFEYQVQKWMGSLYSVGMSSSAVQGIASALGKLAAGDIEGLIGSGTGNLMVMAANEANLSIAEVLAKGLDESNTNKLMQAMVDYLANIYTESAESRVVQQQMANIYGVHASDLRAAANLATSATTMSSILKSSSNYADSISHLMKMADTMYFRTSIGEMMTNVWDNLQYSVAAGIANNPVLYALNKTAGLLEDAVGGIPIAFATVMGSGVDLHTTVADLMRVGAMSSSILQNYGRMFSIFGGSGGLSPRLALHQLGVSKEVSSVARGQLRGNVGGIGTSESGVTTLVGNVSSSDIKEATLASAGEEQESQMAQAKESEDSAVTTDVIDEHIVNIYTLLQNVVDGQDALTVKLDYSSNMAWSK